DPGRMQLHAASVAEELRDEDFVERIVERTEVQHRRRKQNLAAREVGVERRDLVGVVLERIGRAFDAEPVAVAQHAPHRAGIEHDLAVRRLDRVDGANSEVDVRSGGRDEEPARRAGPVAENALILAADGDGDARDPQEVRAHAYEPMVRQGFTRTQPMALAPDEPDILQLPSTASSGRSGYRVTAGFWYGFFLVLVFSIHGLLVNECCTSRNHPSRSRRLTLRAARWR